MDLHAPRNHQLNPYGARRCRAADPARLGPVQVARKACLGGHIADLARFRANAPFNTAQEYENLYRRHPRVHAATNNFAARMADIAQDGTGDNVCDVGCGTGYLLTLIHAARPEIAGFTH